MPSSYLIVFTSTNLCLGVWLYIKNMEHRTQRYPVHTSWYMLCAGLLYLLALACAWEYDYTSTTWNTEIPSTYLLVHALCWFILFTSTSLCLGVWLYINNMEHRTQRYTVNTSWYMLRAGLLYLLALVCAWEYDYTSRTWNTEIPSIPQKTEHRDTQFIPLGICVVLVYCIY